VARLVAAEFLPGFTINLHGCPPPCCVVVPYIS
jgi:hypothetical protein